MRLEYDVRGQDSTVPWVSADACPLGQDDVDLMLAGGSGLLVVRTMEPRSYRWLMT